MFNFMKYRWLYFGISALVIVPGLVSLALFGLRASIDFTGGTLWEIKVNDAQVTPEVLSNETKDVLQDVQVKSLEGGVYQLQGKSIEAAAKDQLLTRLKEKHGEIEEQKFESLGPTIGRELILKTIAALGIGTLIITFYLARQFNQLKYGVCAILAMGHDLLVILGVFSLFGHFFNIQVDVLFVTALLTTLSFSVHDTIVVYDRIRELHKLHPREDIASLMNVAILQTMSRSLNNSITVIIMLLTLVLLGGESVRWFAVALLIGAVTGTYSSTFTAVPLLLTWEELQLRFK